MNLPTRMLAPVLCCLNLLAPAFAQTIKPAFEQSPPGLSWTLQDSGTAASLRGIAAVNNKTAWASGTEGTVLRTTDGGAHWTKCSTPSDAAKLDFRGVQAWDGNEAIVMSSGPGDQSRLYRTTDACRTWKLIARNADGEGFWDAILLWTPTNGFLAGDPIDGHPFLSEFTGTDEYKIDNVLYGLKARTGSDGAYAASNSSLAIGPFREEKGAAREVWFAVGGSAGSRVIHFQHFNGGEPGRVTTSSSDAPMFPSSQSAGIFSLAFHGETGTFRNVISTRETLIAVGGDYTKPAESSGTAAWSADHGLTWHVSNQLPHGFRSSVAWSDAADAWISVGTNGSDVSRDDGKTWQSLDDGNWNALSLPFVVGPKGRIARLKSN